MCQTNMWQTGMCQTGAWQTGMGQRIRQPTAVPGGAVPPGPPPPDRFLWGPGGILDLTMPRRAPERRAPLPRRSGP